jgi:hypothetical protein
VPRTTHPSAAACTQKPLMGGGRRHSQLPQTLQRGNLRRDGTAQGDASERTVPPTTHPSAAACTHKLSMGGGRRTHSLVKLVISPISVGMVPLSGFPWMNLCPQQHTRQPRRGTQNTHGRGTSNSQVPERRQLAHLRWDGAAQ